ncbi:MAG: DUF1002 domain-containing protein [Lentihominibacter sp.]|nr:DUF1002 domain-containing protein [Clostridiales bacterium]MDY2681103.1 DUF1002 domain-containing protein [Lentihominibacter sp.]
MKKTMKLRKMISMMLVAAVAAVMVLVPAGASADSVNDSLSDTYVSLGANLSDSERATVLSLLGLTEDELQNCTVVQVTNQEEHEYLDAYLSSSVIGNRAISSVKVVNKDDGNGINVETHNITYCTETMYQNALATAGLEDADVTVAGPYNVSGTAGLIGAIKAYDTMTGKDTAEESVEAATQELVTTSELGESMGDQESASTLVGAVKDKVVSEGLETEEEIRDAIEDTAEQMDITLTEDQIAKITALMDEIKNLDIDINALKEQAKGLYDKLDSLDIDLSSAQGFFSRIGEFFSNLWDRIFG